MAADRPGQTGPEALAGSSLQHSFDSLHLISVIHSREGGYFLNVLDSRERERERANHDHDDDF